ncbi:MAG: ribosomal-protein-alanine N-acetyltransferase [Erysipelotrichia bacterium]|nr:ribosomal-protein-alanine N-acetyltransferase [Erysipelotrichia bacterium]
MIRTMIQQDMDQVLNIETAQFTSPWPEKEFLYELYENPFAHLLVEERNGIIAGYCDWWMMYDQAQIANLAVAPEFLRQHIADDLMKRIVHDAVASNCENLSLEVRVSNDAAIRLYEKHGFIRVNTRKNYYSDPCEDAYLMVMPLGGLENDEVTRN